MICATEIYNFIFMKINRRKMIMYIEWKDNKTHQLTKTSFGLNIKKKQIRTKNKGICDCM